MLALNNLPVLILFSVPSNPPSAPTGWLPVVCSPSLRKTKALLSQQHRCQQPPHPPPPPSPPPPPWPSSSPCRRPPLPPPMQPPRKTCRRNSSSSLKRHSTPHPPLHPLSHILNSQLTFPSHPPRYPTPSCLAPRSCAPQRCTQCRATPACSPSCPTSCRSPPALAFQTAISLHSFSSSATRWPGKSRARAGWQLPCASFPPSYPPRIST
jgi:hypothetical protein